MPSTPVDGEQQPHPVGGQARVEQQPGPVGQPEGLHQVRHERPECSPPTMLKPACRPFSQDRNATPVL